MYHKCGEIINSKDRELIRHIIQCCNEASLEGMFVPINKATERAARYCNVCGSSIRKIRKESSSRSNEALGTPGKERKRGDIGTAIVDNFDRRVIRDTIQDFYARQKTTSM
jgi:predicted nucleic acid-binding Zn ribbon protein